jgi:hypothetical protein
MLELPRTIKDLSEDEFEGDASLIDRVKAKQHAKIVEGYKLIPNNEQTELPFIFYSEININNSRLWDLFIFLCKEQLPDTAALIFGFYDNEVNYGKYLAKVDIIIELAKYQREIVEDCHLELGLIYHSELTLIEIYIAEAKYIKVWGCDEESFRNIMNAFNLKEVENIEFIDEYPKVVYPLKTIMEDAVDTFEIITDLQEKFTE